MTGPSFEIVGFAQCKETAGEVLLAQFRDSFKFCVKSCIGRDGCASLTYFDNSDVCKLYRTPCFRIVASEIGFSLRLTGLFEHGAMIESATKELTTTTTSTTTTTTKQSTTTTTQPTTTTQSTTTTTQSTTTTTQPTATVESPANAIGLIGQSCHAYHRLI